MTDPSLTLENEVLQQDSSPDRDIGPRYLIIALIIGGVIRLLRMVSNGLDPDEIHSLEVALYPTLGSLIEHELNSPHNPHPGGHYLFHWVWIRLAGTSEFALRFPSFVMGMLSIVIIYRLASNLFDARVGGYASMWAAITSGMISTSVQARMYSQLILLSVLMIDQINRHLLNEKIGPQGVIKVTCVGILLAYTHYFGTMLAMLSLVIAILFRIKSRFDKMPAVITLTLIILGFLPQLQATLADFFVNKDSGGVRYINNMQGWDLILVILSRQLNGSMPLALIIILCCASMLLITLPKEIQSYKRGWTIIGIWWGGSLGVPLFIQVVGPAVITPANMHITLPATMIALGALTGVSLRILTEKWESIARIGGFTLVGIHLLFIHGVIISGDPDLRGAFKDAGDHVEGESVVLVVNSRNLAWPSGASCYYCEKIPAQIEMIIEYEGNISATLNELNESYSSEIVFIHLTGWVEPMDVKQVAAIESSGNITHRISERMIEGAIISLGK